MKVRISSKAKAYIAKEGAYLRKHSPMGAKTFGNIVRRAKKVIETFPDGGATDSAIPLTGARRASVDGYLFDYDLIDGEVWILGVISSAAVNTIEVEDDLDYEAEPSSTRSKNSGES